MFESNNKSISLNILYVPHNTFYLPVKSLSALLKGITSKHVGDFYCLNCFHAYATKNKLEKHKKVCENHDYSV